MHASWRKNNKIHILFQSCISATPKIVEDFRLGRLLPIALHLSGRSTINYDWRFRCENSQFGTHTLSACIGIDKKGHGRIIASWTADYFAAKMMMMMSWTKEKWFLARIWRHSVGFHFALVEMCSLSITKVVQVFRRHSIRIFIWPHRNTHSFIRSHSHTHMLPETIAVESISKVPSIRLLIAIIRDKWRLGNRNPTAAKSKRTMKRKKT